MDLITEKKLRELYKKEKIDCLKVSSNSIITPSARQFLRDQKIELIFKDQENNEAKKQVEIENETETPDEISKGRATLDKAESDFKYQSYYTGAYFSDKPEAMTQIFANQLVYKDHPIIEFRGKIDSMQSEILNVMLVIKEKEISSLYDDLNETLDIVRHLLSAEVKGEEFEYNKIIGLTAAEVREQSHFPQKYFGIKHILPNADMGEVLVKLNSLRSSIREVEIAAVKAFHWERDVDRVDLIKVLNRMSSVFYVMMCKYQAGEYK